MLSIRDTSLRESGGVDWIAPELLSGDKRQVDLLRADVYSLAATAYWLYTGQAPSRSLNESRTLLASRLDAQLPSLIEGLLSGLSPQANLRPAHAGLLLSACVQRPIKISSAVDLSRALYAYPLV